MREIRDTLISDLNSLTSAISRNDVDGGLTIVRSIEAHLEYLGKHGDDQLRSKISEAKRILKRPATDPALVRSGLSDFRDRVAHINLLAGHLERELEWNDNHE